MLSLGYRNFTLIFFRIYFLSIATFFLKLWLSVCHLNIFQDVLTFISGISSFENRLSSPCSSNSFYFETKIMEGSQKLWNSFFFLLCPFPKNLQFSGCDILSRLYLSCQLNIFCDSLHLWGSYFWWRSFYFYQPLLWQLKYCLFPISMAIIVRKTNSFIKSFGLSIQTIPVNMESNRQSLLTKNCPKILSCALLLRSKALVIRS